MTEFSAADIAQAGADGFRAGVASVRGGYDRHLISLMLECPSDYTNEAVAEQASLLRMADKREAEGVHTARRVDTPGDAEAVRSALAIAEAALSDIGDADREPGDNVAWLERRAAQVLPQVRAALGKGVG